MSRTEPAPAPGRAEATKQRILDAAFEEFSTHGVAGARVDRIARAAGCNKNLIYIYFGSKEALFEATLRERLRLIYEENPILPDALPEYAGRTFDFVMDHPEVIKLLAWTKLDPDAQQPSGRGESIDGKVAMLRAAQAEGRLTDAWDAEFLITFVMALATAWVPAFPYGTAGVPRERIRAQIVRAVTALLGT